MGLDISTPDDDVPEQKSAYENESEIDIEEPFPAPGLGVDP